LSPWDYVLAHLPTTDDLFQIHLCILQHQVHQQGLRTVGQGCPGEMATWETRTSALGQVKIQERGIVNNPTPLVDDKDCRNTEGRM
jgi:hypothetical protein